MTSTPVLRQSLVAASPVIAAISLGGLLGFPNVLMQQLHTNNSTIELDFDTSSWIGSIHGLAGIPTILMPTFMQWKGRKIAFLTSCLFIMVGSTVAYAASSASTILIGESFHGLGCNSILTVSTCSVSEMTDPKYRNIFGVSYFILLAVGLAAVGVTGQYLHWKTVSLLILVPITLAFLNVCFIWPESPSWLALKGRYVECERNFYWLRGNDTESRKELMELLYAHKETVHKEPFCQRLFRRDFCIPAFLMFFILNTMYWSGVNVVIIYFADIVILSSGDADAASYGTIAMSVILLLSTIICAFLVKIFPNKSVLLFSTSGTMSSALFCCIVTHLQSLGFFEKSLICLYGLIMYIAFCALGLTTIGYNIGMEIMPVKHRGIGGALYVVYICILHSSSLKAAPYMFLYIGLGGTFLVYTVNAFISILILCKFVPETKNRTLQELEDYFNNGKFIKRDNDVHDSIINSRVQ